MGIQFGSYFGNNPASPYIVMQPAEGGAVLPTYALQFQQTLPSGVTVSDFYQLANNEALVTIITLPPLGAYWSLQSYLVERPTLYYVGKGIPQPINPTCPGPYIYNGFTRHVTSDCAYDIFSLFNNTINNADVVNQTGSGNGFSSADLSSQSAVAIVTTPNSAIFTDLQNKFSSGGFGASNEIFAEGMPAAGSNPLLNTGLAAADDVFATIIRYAVPAIQAYGTEWLANPATYIHQYRIEAPASVGTTLYRPAALNQQSDNTDETAGASTYCTAGQPPNRLPCDVYSLAQILQNYLNTRPGATDTYSTVTASPNAYDGFTSISNGTFCIGGTADNEAYQSFSGNAIPVGQYAIMVGVLHSASVADTPTSPLTPMNNAAYTSLAAASNLNGENTGIVSASQSNQSYTGFASQPIMLTGSAAALLSALHLSVSGQLASDLPYLYAQVFTQPNSNCGQDALCQQGTHYVTFLPTYALPDPISLVERAYLLPLQTGQTTLQPQNLTGASTSEIVSPIVVCDQTDGGCSPPSN